MMKRLVFSCFMAAVSFVSVADTLTVRQLFTEMPDTIIPYLSKNNRLDFLDFMDSNMKAEVTNELGGKSLMTALTDDSITIRLNEACHIDLLLLSTNQPVDSCNQVICLLRTVGLENENHETDVEYYSVRWRRLTDEPQLLPSDKKRLFANMKKQNIVEYLLDKLNKD